MGLTKIGALSFFRRRWPIILLIGGAVLGAGFVLRRQILGIDENYPPSVTVNERQAAIAAFEDRYGMTPDRADTLSWLAETYLKQHRYCNAVDCFAQIPSSHAKYGHMARFQQGRTLLSEHRAVEAERQLRELIALEECSPQIDSTYLIDARQRLRHILEVELRFEERQKLLRGVVAREEADHFELLAYCFPSHLRWNGPVATKWLEEFFAVDAADPHIRVALGRYRIGQGNLVEARRILESVVSERPDDLWARSALIACLHEADDPDELDRQIAALPSQSDDDPWLLLVHRGLYANQHGHLQQGMATFERLLKHDPTSTQGWAGLVPALPLIQDAARKKQILRMNEGMGRIQNNLGKIIQRPKDPESYLALTDLCAEFELLEAGQLFSRYAARLAPQHVKIRQANEYFSSQLAIKAKSHPVE